LRSDNNDPRGEVLDLDQYRQMLAVAIE